MPEYTYTCESCKASRTIRRPLRQMKPWRVRCRECGGWCLRDYRADLARARTDPDACDADADRQLDQKYSGQQVERAVLSQSLAHVPGIPKVRAKDGRTYAAFRNRQHRRRVLNEIGLPDAE